MMKISDFHIGFVGFGHMAQVICRAMDQARLIPRSQISFIRKDPQKAKKSEEEFGITGTSLERLINVSQIVLLAVRPVQAEQVLKEMAPFWRESKLLISVVSGFKCSFYQKYLGEKAKVLRVMPNIASAVGEGMTLFTPNLEVPAEYLEASRFLFGAMGEVLEIPESLMDVGTVIAGCGPGFVFRFIEAFANAGKKEGLPYEEALKMAAQAFAGAARLILKGAKPARLLEQIATPNGLTEAGLKEMTHRQIDQHIQGVIEVAMNRCKEMAR